MIRLTQQDLDNLTIALEAMVDRRSLSDGHMVELDRLRSLLRSADGVYVDVPQANVKVAP